MRAELEKLLGQYRKLPKDELKDRIRSIKSRMGKRLVILGHHYQSREVIELSDFRGDSFKLSKTASEQKDAEYIVFCGVHFMAESAAILAGEGQKVFIPDLSAGCPMADMAFITQAEQAWQSLEKIIGPGKTTPVVYVNSDAELKAFCGRNNGACCTSSNAAKIFSWALSRSEKVLFFPDEHLGRNSAFQLGMNETDLALYDPARGFSGADAQTLRGKKVVLWKGYCHIHTKFTVEHIRQARAKYPGARIIVHPETPRPVVELADQAGSTENIIKFAESQPEGTVIVIGTEIHLVQRLAAEQTGKRKVVPLARSVCGNMAKINLANLLFTLESMEKDGGINLVTVPEPTRSQARVALQNMLSHA